MAIDARHENVFLLTEAPAKAEPIIGKRLATSTFYRWAQKGVRGVRLEVRWLGGAMRTSEEALQTFFDRLTAQQAGATPPPAAPTISRKADIDRAKRELMEAGI